ncbi:MAG: glycosyltransferase family 4 protein [Gammaproteobacteria bacterium]|nr:glycosyltransferase family 4 protein [Gammaproteobacteria bacterium]
MKLAFLLYNYFPYGGLQRDFFDVAMAATKRGHTVDVYTLDWHGEKPSELSIHEIDVSPMRNHNRYRRFTEITLPLLTAGKYHRVIGFNKMPGLDVYYGADPCFEHKARNLRNWYYRYTARYRHFATYEGEVFSPTARTRLLMLSEIEKHHCMHYYNTPENRFIVLPPAVGADYMRPANADDISQQFRMEFGFCENDNLVVCVGSDFQRKGVDRTIRAMAALSDQTRTNCHLLVVGLDDANPFTRLANWLNIEHQVHFYQGRDDVPRFLFASDLFVHAARSENTGTVILEAIVAGTPALVTANCGYANHVTRADAGLVNPTPFDQDEFNQHFADMLTSPKRNQWRENGVSYGKTQQLQGRAELTVDLIEQFETDSSRN